MKKYLIVFLTVSAWICADDRIYHNPRMNTIVAENTTDFNGRWVHTKVIKYLNNQEYSIWLDTEDLTTGKQYSCVTNRGHLKDPRIKPGTIKRLKALIAREEVQRKK